MSNVLFAWEIGEAGGHIVRFKPIGDALIAAGHELFIAAKDLSRGRVLFPDRNVKLLQAPRSTPEWTILYELAIRLRS